MNSDNVAILSQCVPDCPSLGAIGDPSAGFAGFGPPIFYNLFQCLVLAGFIENSPFKPSKPSRRVFKGSQSPHQTLFGGISA